MTPSRHKTYRSEGIRSMQQCVGGQLGWASDRQYSAFTDWCWPRLSPFILATITLRPVIRPSSPHPPTLLHHYYPSSLLQHHCCQTTTFTMSQYYLRVSTSPHTASNTDTLFVSAVVMLHFLTISLNTQSQTLTLVPFLSPKLHYSLA